MPPKAAKPTADTSCFRSTFAMTPTGPRKLASCSWEPRAVVLSFLWGAATDSSPGGRVLDASTVEREKNQPRAQVEIGRDGDLVAQGVAGRSFYPDPDSVRQRQASFPRLADGAGPLIATADHDNGFAYRVAEQNPGECLAVLAKQVNDDLFDIGAAIRGEDGGSKRRPPDRIPHLYCHGLRTIVLPPDSANAESLHEPWSRTGIVLVPVLVGYTTLYFPAFG